MTLYERMMQTFCIVTKERVSDGEGGYETKYVDGKEFEASVVRDTSTEARIAEHDGVTSQYTVTTHKDVTLNFHDVIKRKSDGLIYRITSQGGEVLSPSSPVIDIAQVSAEKWKLTE